MRAVGLLKQVVGLPRTTPDLSRVYRFNSRATDSILVSTGSILVSHLVSFPGATRQSTVVFCGNVRDCTIPIRTSIVVDSTGSPERHQVASCRSPRRNRRTFAGGCGVRSLRTVVVRLSG